MQRLLTLFAMWFLMQGISYAQVTTTPPNPNLPAALPTREISGMIRNENGDPVPAANVRLTSASDTVSVSTNSSGIFVLKNIKSATFSLEVKSLAYGVFIGKFLQNDAIPRIVMDPIVLKEESTMIEEVVIDGSPSITYKPDTVEYKAKDYVVRPNATVDELLKKMEDMEVGTDGTLKHQGKDVTKAKINGKTYLGGDVGQAIKNLPSEIVDKIQMVDDYGDEAERTGIKDGEPDRILNVVTRADKSVGNTLSPTLSAGNNERYEAALFATRINKNQTLGLNARLNNTVNGVASSGGFGGGGFGGGGFGGMIEGGSVISIGGGGRGGSSMGGSFGGGRGGSSGGNTRLGNVSFSIRDKIGTKINYNASYTFGNNRVNDLTSSESQNFSSLGTTFSKNEGNSLNQSENHNLNFDFEFNINKKNFLRFQPTFSYSSTDRSSMSSVFQTGLIHQDQMVNAVNTSSRPNIGGNLFYQHYFDKRRRNLSASLNISRNTQNSDQQNKSNIIYYYDDSDLVLKDSLVNRLIDRSNKSQSIRSNLTFVEPLTDNTQLEFGAQVNRNAYDNNAITSNIMNDERRFAIDSLSNIFNYSFTQSRISFNYRFGMSNTQKFKFSLGAAALPGLLAGTNASLGTEVRRSSFNIVPVARFQYLWSRQHSISLNYNGNASEPSFDQLQPVRDVSNVQNPVVGNPNLKVAFNHSLNLNYNNYLQKSKLNYSVGLNASTVENAISRNVVQIRDEYNSLKNETRYINLNGAYRFGGNYSISKQLANRKYSLAYSGNVSFNHGVSMSNNLMNYTDSWNFTQRFSPRINPTEWLEVNPSVSYRYSASNNSLPTSIDNKNKTVSLGVDGRFIFFKSLIFNYNASKNFVSGINANLTNNPFVINGSLQKELFNRKATISIEAYDWLNQNNFINRNVTDDSIVDTKTNTMSRFFMFKLSMRLQKWTGAQPRGGRSIIRMGDGSFVN